MTLIVDASVILKLLVKEADWELALDVMTCADELIAPDWIRAEVGNALAKKVRFTSYSAEAAAKALDTVPVLLADFVPHATLVQPALALSIRTEHPFYDCMYLALAIERDARVVTADGKFVAAAVRSGLGERVRALCPA